MFHFGWGWDDRWEPLLEDFVKLGRQLEELGFRIVEGEVVIS